MSKQIIYAGIGSRETPKEIQDFFTLLAMKFAEHGYILRSGHADGADDAIHDNLNAFTSEEFAQKIHNRQLLERKLIKFSLENKGYENDWKSALVPKYSIYYSYSSNTLYPSANVTTKNQGSVYFSSEEIATQAIEKFHDELIQYFTEWNV